MKVHLVDGTWELFRAYFGAPSRDNGAGVEVGATLGFMSSLLGLLRYDGATHVAVAFDHEIESFRNKLYAGYKTGEGIEEDLLSQFPLAERAAELLGFVVWPMAEYEADDGMASGARLFRDAAGVDQVVICSPDKDLCQCVRGDRVVTYNRMTRKMLNAEGVKEKFGVGPESIADLLALMGDSSDGIPGVPRWGAKSSSVVLAEYGRIEDIPLDAAEWAVKVRGAVGLAENLRNHMDDAMLFRSLTVLRDDLPLREELSDLEWRGADQFALGEFCDELGDRRILERISNWRQ